ncbi:MAG: anaerobic ribonucleoside-triphosphate reductase activating protein [Defluviitoga tunisiensis]|jgi:pyruvate formate lyase activating enzyme|uniref:Pyruvate-formate lyase-activating enzyme n=1 Tax=Defluviitoga tunisiensis TaxID=1006576 RepID=A0A0C7NN82_DEFTU|nr:anaerobic ribonucleoside-triphosphate reductase activating protein [Defluviitoga tunisiensis]MDD3600764.1 anaerobic ribonucleoside-triphosphate reductase activating protein [Defluviitoga tunisiensis]MDY0379169.1 anaerobic ribonucleoside-triphosphate reductase activating protein [Defluviitoga tunisiensis]CEP77377.1 Pyruvate-formate lyase-activating enzyme [Defluviitoga tunisiensis]HHV01628.1 anaerobic ribonucleoside-triphosphate reductase activating protein [Defluviitoga tunisiensis]HOB55600
MIKINFAGIRTFSFVDYPKKICAVVYTPGCNFKCPWCHNWKIAYTKNYSSMEEIHVLNKLIYLKKRISAVCITGGEPTIHSYLPKFIQKLKHLRYSVKLDTNGTNPEMVKCLIENNMIDYIALDIKAKPENYSKLIGKNDYLFFKISRTIDILRNSTIDYEFRMTFVPGLSNEEDINFFENFLKDEEKGYITIANSTELFQVKRQYSDFNINKLILR